MYPNQIWKQRLSNFVSTYLVNSDKNVLKDGFTKKSWQRPNKYIIYGLLL